MSAAVSVLISVAGVTAAMASGICFIFSNTVVGALSKLGPEAGAAAMVEINAMILNPAFLAVFLGPGLLCTLAAAGAWLDGHDARVQLALGAAVVVVGLIGVTAAVNVPLNDALAAQATGTPAGTELWDHYRARWTRWNTVRAAAAATTALLFALA